MLAMEDVREGSHVSRWVNGPNGMVRKLHQGIVKTKKRTRVEVIWYAIDGRSTNLPTWTSTHPIDQLQLVRY